MMPVTIQDDLLAAPGDIAVDLLILTAILVPALAALGLGALRWGVDSRDPMPDDRRR